MSANLIGALLMMASMACFTINDALLKATDNALPLFQLLFLRGVLATALIGVLAYNRGALHLRLEKQDRWLIAGRSAAEIGAAYFFVTALLNMPLANVTAILQVLPLTVTLGSAFFFNEPVGWRRFLAIAIGFVGMLLIVRPGTEGFSLWSLYALLAVLCVTARDLFTRRMSPAAPSLLVTLAASVAVMLASGLASTTTDWAPVTPDLWLLLVSSALFIVGGYFFSVRVMRVGDIAFIAPFRYTGLIWALVLGFFAFNEWPEPTTLFGAAIIVATGLFTLYREHRVAQGKS